MASDVVTRFRLETTQYDSALRDASERLRDVISVSKAAGSSFTDFSQKSVEAARSLGGMATGGRTAKEKVQELVKVFNSLAKEYNSLSDAQKRSDFGQALGSSMQQLKERIKEAKSEMQNMQTQTASTKQATGGLGGVVEQLAGKVGLSTKAFSALGLAGAGVGTALKVAGDAFMQNESNVDEWGRTLEAGKSVYSSFLNALNNGDFSGFLTGIGQVVQAAKDAYNAIDELNTRMTIINPERAKLQKEQARLQAVIKREGKDSAAGKSAQSQLRALEPQLAQSYMTESRMNKDAFVKSMIKQAKEKGIDLSQSEAGALLQTFSSDRLFRQFRANAKGSKGTRMVGGGAYGDGYMQSYDTRNKNQKLLDIFTDEWRNKNSGYLTASFNAEANAYNMQKGNARYLTPSSGGGGGRGGRSSGGSSIDDIKSKVKMPDFQALIKATEDLINSYSGVSAKAIDEWISQQREKLRGTNFGTDLYESIDRNLKGTNIFQSLLNYAQKNGIQLDQTLIKETWDKIVNGDVIPQSNIEEIRKKIEEGLGGKSVTVTLDYLEGKIKEEEKKEPEPEIKMSEDDKEKKERVDLQAAVNKALEPMQNMVSGLGQVSSGLQQMGIKLPAGIDTAVNAIQGLMSVIQGVTAIIQLANTSIVALTAATNVNSAVSAIPLARGGVVRAAQGVFVPGNSPSGDMVPALLNSGELVLNRAQQGNLAAQLEGGMSQGGNITGTLRGEDIILAINNVGRRNGSGELIRMR